MKPTTRERDDRSYVRRAESTPGRAARSNFLFLLLLPAVLFLLLIQTGCTGLTGATQSAAAESSSAATNSSPSITTQPVGQTVPPGQTATFFVVASGTGSLTYQWNKNSAAITGATAASYTTPATSTSDNGAQFAVTVGNTVGSATSVAAALTVSSSPTGALVANPSSMVPFTATVGGAAPAAQTVNIVSDPPASVPVTISADQSWITMSATSGVTKATVQFGVNPVGMAAGSYTGHVVVTASGVSNSPFSIPVALVVSQAPATAPAITAQPGNQTVLAGQTATFSVIATGTAPLTYQWNKNGAAVAGATSSSYTTPAAATADNGAQFTVTVSNGTGSVTSGTATLTVNPSSGFVISAAPAAFSFAATTGGSAPSLQTVVFVATPATPLPFTMSADQSWITMSAGSGVTKATLQFGANPAGLAAGNYSGHVLVTPTGAGNPPLTIPISLTVSAPTPGQLVSSVPSLSFGNVNVGSSGTLSVTLTNSGGSNVTISNASVSGPGFGASGVPAGTILNPGQTATLSASFNPSAAGGVTGSVTISSNAPNSPITVSLSGTGVQSLQHSVALAWVAGTSGVVGYNVYRSSVSGGLYTMVSSLDPNTSFADSTVQAGQTYFYVVTSVGSGNVESVYSNVASTTIPTP